MLPSFIKWLSLRNKKQSPPVPGRMSDEESRALFSRTPTPSPRELDPDELEAAWKDFLTADPRSGITDAQRKAANANNPLFHMDPDELEDLWNRSKSQN